MTEKQKFILSKAVTALIVLAREIIDIIIG